MRIPSNMFKPGEYVARHLEPHEGGELDDEQIQPNGVDLKIDKVLKHSGKAHLTDGEYKKPARSEAAKISVDSLAADIADTIDSDWVYNLKAGGYVIVYDEKITEIPEGHIGIVFPRSRVLRTSGHVNTAVWDSGYSGRGEGGLMLTQPTFLDPDMKIAQMTFARASHTTDYNGSHQGERTE